MIWNIRIVISIFFLFVSAFAFSQSDNRYKLVLPGYEMIFIKGGTFVMGCTQEQEPDCYSVEKPAHKVKLKNFYIGKTEVTQAQWFSVMGNNPSLMPACDSCPVENVSWNEVQLFINKLNELTGKKYRLPTEAEWEFAARGGASSSSVDAYKYSGSNNQKDVAWYYLNSENITHPVEQKKNNELGIYDMSGNVWEWCSDWFDGAYYSYSKKNNPKGPDTGKEKIMRGGSWYSGYGSLRNAARSWYEPDLKRINTGFRLASSSK